VASVFKELLMVSSPTIANGISNRSDALITQVSSVIGEGGLRQAQG
jgi:hypothetical protein